MSQVNKLLGPPGNKKLAKMTFLIQPRDKIISGKLGVAIRKIISAAGSEIQSVLNQIKIPGISLKIPKTWLPFPVMYNPESLSLDYEKQYAEVVTIGNKKPLLQFQNVVPDTLEVELFFDGTGASVSNGLLGVNFLSEIARVADDGIDILIKSFLSLTLGIHPSEHEPNYVWVIWGAISFKGIVQKAEVTYTMFDRIGRPVRGTMRVTLKSTEKNAEELKAKLSAMESPDLTKVYQVKAGDTLPNIAKAEYDDESFYLKLADVNDLKNYRKLVPGQTLILPPLSKTI